MSIMEKYGFEIRTAAPDSEAVQLYTKQHLKAFGYPEDVVPSSQSWFAICRGETVWGVVGATVVSEKSVDIPDFYTHPSRWGILGAYAALEYIRDFARAAQVEVLTATPVWNGRMIRAMEKVFNVKGPTHVIMRYRPWEDTNGI